MAKESTVENSDRFAATADEAYFLLGQAEDIGQETQLFLDSYAYSDRWDVVRRINEPAKHPANPVVMPDQPWEQSVGLPNVIYDEQQQLFRMWYANYDSGKWGGGRGLNETYKRVPYMISYAHSPDGVHWTKPLMDKVPYMGFDKTNIIFTGNVTAQEFHVQFTPEHMREYGRFMLWYRDVVPGFVDKERLLDIADGDRCVLVAFSDDGIDWRQYEGNPVYPYSLDAEHSPVYDESRGIWLLYARPHALAAEERRYTGENVRTRISVTVSRDLQTWTPARHILVPDELDRGESESDKGYFFDRMSVIKYGNQFIGFLTVQPRHGSGSGYIELTSSPDGLRWYRSPIRQPFIGPGRAGDWDAGHTWMLPRIVTIGHWIYLYYVGTARPVRTRYPANVRGIGLARICKDRFVGQYGDVNGAWLLSREVIVTGNRLLVNVSPEHRAWNQQHHGYMLIELLDRTDRPNLGQGHIEGFGQEDCDRIGADEYAQVVSWKGNPDLSALKGKAVYIRFYLKSAYLFGFRFANE